jgi:hypothetical protein
MTEPINSILVPSCVAPPYMPGVPACPTPDDRVVLPVEPEADDA